MYYNLSKQKFNKYEKEFRKTYVGRIGYFSYLSNYLLSLLFLLGMNIWMFLKPGEIRNLDMCQLTYVFVMTAFIICGSIFWVFYMKELKEYIISKKEK